MNWTGGRLSRHSRSGAKGSLNARQKAHFAKVRDNLRNGPVKASPVKWSIFGKYAIQPPTHQRQPSLGPRESSREQGQWQHHKSQIQTDRSRHTARETPHIPIKSQHNRPPPPDSEKQEHHIDTGLYHATPPPRVKRKRGSDASGSGKFDYDEADLIAVKRRSLLQKEDWIGITYQRPLQLAFTAPKHTENVGRRRMITDSHQARYRSQQTTLVSPFMSKVRSHSPLNHLSEGQRGKTDVRIHIGDRIVPPGISSSTTPSRKRGTSIPHHPRNTPQIASSDVMLFDNEDILSSSVSRIINENLYQHHAAGEYSSDLYDQNEGSGDIYETDSEKVLPGTWNNHHFQDDERIRENHHHDSQDELQNIPTTHNTEYAESPKWTTTFASFSPASIKQPKPQSSKISSVLLTSSSETAYGNVAQVGESKPVVPSSQILDDDIWKTWMAPIYSEDVLYDVAHGTEIDGARTISPGVSTAHGRHAKRPGQPRQMTQSYDYNEEERSEEDEPKVMYTASRILNPSLGSLSAQEDVQAEQSYDGNILRPMSHDRDRKMLEDRPGNIGSRRRRLKVTRPPSETEAPDDSSNLESDLQEPIADGGEPTHQSLIPAHSKKEQDPDEIWKAFVFGSDEADETEKVAISDRSPEPFRLNPQVVEPDGYPQVYRFTPAQFTPITRSHAPNANFSNPESSPSGSLWNLPTGVSMERIRSSPAGANGLQSSASLDQSRISRLAPSNGATFPCESGPVFPSIAVSSGSETRQSKSSVDQASPTP